MVLSCDTIGETIRTLRKQRGMTQEALSAKAEVDPSAIASLELGRRKAGGRVDTLLRLLDALDMECVVRPKGDGWAPIQIQTDKGWVTAIGWMDLNVPGIAVVAASAGRYSDESYTVSHIQSGKRLVPKDFTHRVTAITCMRWLGHEAHKNGLSWAMPEEQLKQNHVAMELARQAAKAFGGDGDV